MSDTTDDAAAIESFAALLDEAGTGRHHRRPDDADPQLLALLDVTRMLARSARPTTAVPARQLPTLDEVAGPSPAFREKLLDRLMQEIPRASGESVAVPGGRGRRVAPRPRQGDTDLVAPAAQPSARLANQKTQVIRVVKQSLSGRARLAALVGVAAGALAISGVSLASGDAVPGDTLYSVKSLGEQARLFLAGSDADRGRLHLDFARIRLVEARQVGPDDFAAVLEQMDREITEGARLLFTAGVGGAGPDAIDAVTTFVQQHRAELLELRASVTATGDPARRSLDLLTDVEIRANELRAAIADGCAIAETDRLGPKPSC